MSYDFLCPFILVLLFIIGYCVYLLYKSYLKNELKNKISKINSSEHFKPIDQIFKMQSLFEIEEKHKLSSPEEIENIKKILICFTNELNSDFWEDRLYLNYNLSHLDYKEYFTLQLYYFLLENHLNKKDLFFHKCRIDMYYVETVWYNENGCVDYIYNLTDFAVAYHKLFLLCTLFCENNNRILKILPFLSNKTKSKSIIETLERGKMDVIRR